MDDKHTVLDTIYYHTIDEVERAINYYCVLKLNRSSFETLPITEKDIEIWGRTCEWRGSYLGISMLIEIHREHRGGYSNHLYKRQRWLGATKLETHRHDHYLGEIDISLLDNRDDMEVSQIVNRPRSPVRLRITGCWPPFDTFWQGLAQFLTGNLDALISPVNSSLILDRAKQHIEAQSEPATSANRDIDSLIAKILDKLGDRDILTAIETEMEEAERQRDAVTYLKLMRYKERLLKTSPARCESPIESKVPEQVGKETRDIDKRLIRSFSISGDVHNFRAFMEQLAINLPQKGTWVSSKGEQLGFWYEPKYGRNFVDETPPKRGSWEVRLRPDGCSGIEAYEQAPAKTRIDFLDAYMPHTFLSRTPIGPAFEEFYQWVREEAKKVELLIEAQFEPPVGGNVPRLTEDDSKILTARMPEWKSQWFLTNSDPSSLVGDNVKPIPIDNAFEQGGSRTGFTVTKKREWTANYNDVDAIAETFNAFWTQYVSTDQLQIKQTFSGFDIFETYQDTEHCRGEIHFYRARTGDSKIAYKIYAAPPESIFFRKAPPPLPERELENILEDFRKATESAEPGLASGSTSDTQMPIDKGGHLEPGETQSKLITVAIRSNQAIEDDRTLADATEEELLEIFNSDEFKRFLEWATTQSSRLDKLPYGKIRQLEKEQSKGLEKIPLRKVIELINQFEAKGIVTFHWLFRIMAGWG